MIAQYTSLHNIELTDKDRHVGYLLGAFKYRATDDAITLRDTTYLVSVLLARLVDTIKLVSTKRSTAILTSVINDVIAYDDSIRVIKEEFLSDSVVYSADLSGLLSKIAFIVDTLKLSEQNRTHLEATEIISAVLMLVDQLSFFTLEILESTLNYSENIASRLEAYTKLVDQVFFNTEINHSLTLFLSDTFNFGNAITGKAIFTTILTDSIRFLGGISFGGSNYIVYKTVVLNTQSKGISEYENYNFNSFSYPLAAATDGIYRLDDSQTDDGEIINSSIKTGIMDFGTSLKKQVPYAYLGIAENGRVLLKTISNDRGVKKERWYEVRSYTDAIDTTRVQMGKGVKAKYWQFELSNIEGEELFLESMEVIPLTLKRRKQ